MVDLHSYILDFGKHSGTRIVNVPVGYLRWMVNNRAPHADVAKMELDRRGSVLPTIDVSGHAIDRASLLCRKTWHQTSNKGEGLHAWLVRVATEALEQGTEVNGKVRYLGLKFAFKRDGEWPVLLTVLPGKRKAITREEAQEVQHA